MKIIRSTTKLRDSFILVISLQKLLQQRLWSI